jgi:hypothetical protein
MVSDSKKQSGAKKAYLNYIKKPLQYKLQRFKYK